VARQARNGVTCISSQPEAVAEQCSIPPHRTFYTLQVRNAARPFRSPRAAANKTFISNSPGDAPGGTRIALGITEGVPQQAGIHLS